ncbi:MAG: DMT family transporter [Acidiferrobacterales bacterium]
MPIYLLYSITVLIWGSSWFAITLQLEVVHPIWSVGYRFALAAFVLVVFCLATARRLRFGRRDHGFMALQGFFLFSLNYILFYFAIQHLTSGLVAVVFSTIVFMNIINGAVIFRMPVRARVVAGASLGLVGIALVFWPEIATLDVSSTALTSVGLAMLATWAASLGNMVALRNQRQGLPVIETNTFGMAYGAAFTFVAALINRRGAGVRLVNRLHRLTVIFGRIRVHYCLWVLFKPAGAHWRRPSGLCRRAFPDRSAHAVNAV